MKEKQIELLGYLAAILTTASFIPGVIAVWHMKPAPAMAISSLMYIILSLGIAGWFIYGVLIKSRPVIIANGVTFVLTLSILFYKFIYG